MCEDYQARIVIGENDEELYTSLHHMTYYIDDELAVGRIELCFNGTWSPVCEDVWSNKEASVVCHQLGFSRAGKF